jgi:[ribosomal protein S5]-alanine N-acetyltransferase
LAQRERIDTRRLALRRHVLGDIDRIYVVHGDPRALEHNLGDALASREDAEELFQRWDAHW